MRRTRPHQGTRWPAAAGMFYPGGPDELASTIDRLLASAGERQPQDLAGVIVPHAGYIYSGSTAARAYRLLPRSVDRVVLIGPSHFVPLAGVGVSTARAWQTPLGDVALDTEASENLTQVLPHVMVSDESHLQEHSLEVQVPFLQRVLEPGWTLLPLTVGHVAPNAVADVLATALSSPGSNLLVVSTDLSHYLPYDVAVRRDSATAAHILAGQPEEISDEDACGSYGLRGALRLAHRQGWSVEQVGLCNSGDTAGSPDRVVGYGAFVLLPGHPVDEPAEGSVPAMRAVLGEELLRLARSTVEEALASGRQSVPSPMSLPPHLRQEGAAFVTLRDRDSGELLGCVGSLEAHRPLGVDVAAHALDAAFHDSRFLPLTPEQGEHMAVEVSVLGPLEDFPAHGYDNLVDRAPRGKGLFISAGGHRATYLPQVWEEIPDPAAFVASLWRKAGLPPGAWPPGMQVWTYDVAEYAEQ